VQRNKIYFKQGPAIVETCFVLSKAMEGNGKALHVREKGGFTLNIVSYPPNFVQREPKDIQGQHIGLSKSSLLSPHSSGVYGSREDPQFSISIKGSMW
jgi:hypothetical protein